MPQDSTAHSIGRSIDDLLEIMARLRNPDDGCPWDKEQDFQSIAPYTIEEAYEVAEAIRLGDMKALQAELGDLLFQVVYHARMAEEAGDFTFADVVDGISDKMVRRHPHVFGDADIDSAEAQTDAWEAQKAKERAAAEEPGDNGDTGVSALENVPLALPGLSRAYKLQKRAARVGFDWPDLSGVLGKLGEEIQELGHVMAHHTLNPSPTTEERLCDEMGDVLFSCANLARYLKIDPEEALRGGNAKFERRFRYIEEALGAEGKSTREVELDEMEAHWNAAKRLEVVGGGPRLVPSSDSDD